MRALEDIANELDTLRHLYDEVVRLRERERLLYLALEKTTAALAYAHRSYREMTGGAARVEAIDMGIEALKVHPR
jgi:hypothetical protein